MQAHPPMLRATQPNPAKSWLIQDTDLCNAQQHGVPAVIVVGGLWWCECLSQLLCEWHLMRQQQLQSPLRLLAFDQQLHSGLKPAR